MRDELAFPTEVGSRQLVYAAVGSLDDEEKLRGKYIHFSKVVEESDFVISDDGKIVQDKVWVSDSLLSGLSCRPLICLHLGRDVGDFG